MVIQSAKWSFSELMLSVEQIDLFSIMLKTRYFDLSHSLTLFGCDLPTQNLLVEDLEVGWNSPNMS